MLPEISEIGDPLGAPGGLQTEKNSVFGGSSVENGSPSTIGGVENSGNTYMFRQQLKKMFGEKNHVFILSDQKVMFFTNFPRKTLIAPFFCINAEQELTWYPIWTSERFDSPSHFELTSATSESV